MDKMMMYLKSMDEAAEVFKALSTPVRLKIMEMINSPTTMAVMGIPYFLKATPKKVPISGWKFRLMVLMPVSAVMVVP